MLSIAQRQLASELVRFGIELTTLHERKEPIYHGRVLRFAEGIAHPYHPDGNWFTTSLEFATDWSHGPAGNQPGVVYSYRVKAPIPKMFIGNFNDEIRDAIAPIIFEYCQKYATGCQPPEYDYEMAANLCSLGFNGYIDISASIGVPGEKWIVLCGDTSKFLIADKIYSDVPLEEIEEADIERRYDEYGTMFIE